MKAIKEDFAKILENSIDRIELKNLLISNFGELDFLDFKKEWISLTKLSRHILAMANSGGGIIIFGVEEKKDGELTPTGLDSFLDKADIYNGTQKYIPNNLEFNIYDFQYKESEYSTIQGKKFQVLIIKNSENYLPFISEGNSDSIRKSSIYIRRGTQSVEANNEELQKILNRRIETEYSSTSELKLEEHLAQLKILYEQLNKFKTKFGNLITQSLYNQSILNPNENYPKEDYESFISRQISIKKEIIEKELKR